MSERDVDLRKLLQHESFPLSSKYDPEWVIDGDMGPNVLWLTEALCQVMDLKPGMRVMDLGCGGALSSIFLAKEFGLQVWATDLWITAADNWKPICEAGLEDSVFPIHADARELPYADEFFDAIVALDSYHFFGTDVHYLEHHLVGGAARATALRRLVGGEQGRPARTLTASSTASVAVVPSGGVLPKQLCARGRRRAPALVC
jgi:SAM-dependent methyltransferase